jgi:RNA polymerase sigma factor (sigma-70 family)
MAGMADRHLQHRFGLLLREHRKIVLKVAAIYARHAEDRRDLEQEIYAQLWRSFAGFDERRAKLSTWMYRVALNVAISQVRRAGPSTGRDEPLNDAHREGIAGEEPNIDHEQRVTALHSFIGRLDPFNRALILLHLEDRSYTEIADILGITETNVATKINRIKQKLRNQAQASQLKGE